MKKLLAVILFCLISFVSIVPQAANAALTSTEQSLCESSGNKVENGACIPKNDKQLTGQNSYLSNIINLLLFIAGAIAVVVIIIGGIRYITSTGDAMRIKQAKDTILYGIIGLIVAVFAYAIVNSLVYQLTGT